MLPHISIWSWYYQNFWTFASSYILCENSIPLKAARSVRELALFHMKRLNKTLLFSDVDLFCNSKVYLLRNA